MKMKMIVPNPNQKNKDNDSREAACDHDNEGDNVPNNYDNSDNNSYVIKCNSTKLT